MGRVWGGYGDWGEAGRGGMGGNTWGDAADGGGCDNNGKATGGSHTLSRSRRPLQVGPPLAHLLVFCMRAM